MDSQGSVALSRKLGAGGRLDISELPQGLYFLHLVAGERVWVKRVVKE